MASLSNGKKTAQVQPTRRSLPLTLNDDKILGKITEKRKDKTASTQKFNTRSFKHINSSWTPIVHKPSNEQIYKERRELVCNWFDMWTDSQRKRFLDLLFRHCQRRQLFFIQNWFDERVPLKHLDFTRVLPRFLSLHIFSYLDPRSLCRAAMVSWNWNFLTSQDDVWRPKCAKLGWFLPYEPSLHEYGAWKRHYIACTHSLDLDVPSQSASGLYGTLGDGTRVPKKKGFKKSTLKDDIGSQILTARPPWMPPDKNPNDLEQAKRALLNDWNPNDPNVPQALLLYHNKFGQPKQNKLYKGEPEYGLQSSKRINANRAITSGEEHGLETYRESLTKNIELERYEEKRMIELTNQPWEPTPTEKKSVKLGRNLTGGSGAYALPRGTTGKVSKTFLHQEHPRIVFISSRVPAAEVLLDAVMFGVIPIVYEYEGTSLESLLSQLDDSLQGRNAQSIGIFTHTELVSELRMVHGATITIDNIEEPDHVAFLETIANHVLPPEEGGHIDIFVPLGSSDPGTQLMNAITTQTKVIVTSPIDIVGNYNHVSGEWSSKPEDIPPPQHYFCGSKMNVWSNTADTAKEACDVTKKTLGRYFEQKQRDVASQLVGQVVFDALGQVDIQGVNDLSAVLTQGLIDLGHTQNIDEEEMVNVNACSYLGQYLLERGGKDQLFQEPPPNGTLSPSRTMKKPLMLTEHLDEEERLQDGHYDSEVEDITSRNFDDHEKELDEVDHEADDDYNQNNNNNHGADLNSNNNNNGSGDEAEKTKPSRHVSQSSSGPMHTTNKKRTQYNTHKSADFALVPDSGDWGDHPEFSGSQTARPSNGQSSIVSCEWDDTARSFNGTGRYSQSMARENWMDKNPTRVTNQELEYCPDRRTAISKEILASEISYLRTLEITRNTFFLPLKNALASNRAIISAHNVQMIFSDVMTLYSISKRLVDDLRSRCSGWDSSKCLGDIFIKLTGKLKAYVNYLNNYPMILTTIDRCTEQTPQFRAFLKRHEKMPDTRMLSLAELFLIPTRRIQEYHNLLSWFENNTPRDHADRSDLQLAIQTMGDLNELIVDCKDRNKRERELLVLQKTIVQCPTLLESNRFLLKHLDVAHLKTPNENISPELRIYQHAEMLGLYLFNDALIVTKRSTKNFAFERCKEFIYVFEACTGLGRLRVEDLPDSKYVRNAFRMYTPRRSWVCGADSYDDKFNWITLLEDTVRASLSQK